MRRIGLGLLVLAVAACGGGSSEADDLPDTVVSLTTTVPPEGRSFAEWAAAVGAQCERLNPIVEAAGADLEAAQSLDAIVAAMDDFVGVMHEFSSEVRAIPVPTERTREVKDLHEGLERMDSSLDAMRESAANGDVSGIQSALGRMENYAELDLLEASELAAACA